MTTEQDFEVATREDLYAILDKIAPVLTDVELAFLCWFTNANYQRKPDNVATH